MYSHLCEVSRHGVEWSAGKARTTGPNLDDQCRAYSVLFIKDRFRSLWLTFVRLRPGKSTEQLRECMQSDCIPGVNKVLTAIGMGFCDDISYQHKCRQYMQPTRYRDSVRGAIPRKIVGSGKVAFIISASFLLCNSLSSGSSSCPLCDTTMWTFVPHASITALIAGASSPLGEGSRWCVEFKIGNWATGFQQGTESILRAYLGEEDGTPGMGVGSRTEVWSETIVKAYFLLSVGKITCRRTRHWISTVRGQVAINLHSQVPLLSLEFYDVIIS